MHPAYQGKPTPVSIDVLNQRGAIYRYLVYGLEQQLFRSQRARVHEQRQFIESSTYLRAALAAAQLGQPEDIHAYRSLMDAPERLIAVALLRGHAFKVATDQPTQVQLLTAGDNYPVGSWDDVRRFERVVRPWSTTGNTGLIREPQCEQSGYTEYATATEVYTFAQAGAQQCVVLFARRHPGGDSIRVFGQPLQADSAQALKPIGLLCATVELHSQVFAEMAEEATLSQLVALAERLSRPPPVVQH